MRLKTLLFLTLSCVPFIAGAREANVFASGLKAVPANDGISFIISYILNAPATRVEINIYQGTTLVKTIEGTGLAKGENSQEINLDGFSGEYTWSVKATGEAWGEGEAATLVADENNTSTLAGFMSPRGITLDNDTESEFYGRVYVTETRNDVRNVGIFVYDAAFNDVTGQGNVAYSGNVAWSASSSCTRIFLNSDGKIYLSDWSDGHPGVWRADANDLTADFVPVFGGTFDENGLRTNSEGVQISGSIPSCWVEGTGENTVLYTFDEDYVNENGNPKGIYQFNIGNLETPWEQAPSAVIYDNTDKLHQNGNNVILHQNGGWWISQTRWQDGAAIPSLVYVKNNEVLFNSGAVDPEMILRSYSSAICLFDEGTKMAVSCYNNIKVFDVTFDGDVPSLTENYNIESSLGQNCYSIAVDAAHNMYCAVDRSNPTSDGNVGVFALPVAENVCETKAASRQKLVVDVAEYTEINGFCYVLNDELMTARLVPQNTSSPRYTNLFGDIAIPESVFHDGKEYLVVSIGSHAFEGCSGITAVNIPNSVTTIGESAFFGCTGLSSVTIPNSVTTIGESAFIDCQYLTSVTLNCNDIVSRTYPATNNLSNIFGPQVQDIIFGFDVKSIGNYAFSGYNSLISVTLPNTLTFICQDAFSECSSLTSVTLTGRGHWNYNSSNHQGLNNIISQLITINIGSGVTSLDNFGFAPSMVNCYAAIPPTCSSSTFTSYDGELHVPTASTVSYFTAAYWQDFYNFINDLTESVALNQVEVNLFQGATLTLNATTNPAGANVLWSSSNSSVAIVDENGVVMPLDEGECDIFATLESNAAVYASCHITVSYPDFTLSLSSESLEMEIGEDSTLVAIINPDNLGLTPTWSSSDTNVATVENGIVTAIGEGECNITATVREKTATCHVIVVYPEVSVTLNTDILEMKYGEDTTLVAIITPDNLGLAPVWTSSNESVATVENGVVTAVGEGECDVTASVRDKTAICHVIVDDNVVITLSKDNDIIGASQILTVYPSCTPNVPVELLVTSSNPSVALARVVNRTNAPAVGLISFPEKDMAFILMEELTASSESKTPAHASEKAIMIVGVQNGTATITVNTVDGMATPAVFELRVVDVDGDRTITSTDITCLYNYLLSGDETFIDTSDVDGDGYVTSGDITVIYNLILGN